MKKQLGFISLSLLSLIAIFISCSSDIQFDPTQLQQHSSKQQTLRIKTTGYCKCQKCCVWSRDKNGEPIFASGKLKGKKKIIGQTASGHMAKKGTVAADTRYFPFKTKLSIPGYGDGIVQDRGSAVKGYHIDLYFDSHQEAIEWGVRYLDVIVEK